MLAEELRSLPPRRSGWVVLDAARVRAFADATEDWQFVHLDDARTRAETPFDGCIVHGFLTLAMLASLSYQVTADIPGLAASVNYGFDRVRFVRPVPVGARVRATFVVADVTEGEGWMNVHWDASIEVEGDDPERPALVAAWIARVYLNG